MPLSFRRPPPLSKTKRACLPMLDDPTLTRFVFHICYLFITKILAIEDTAHCLAST